MASLSIQTMVLTISQQYSMTQWHLGKWNQLFIMTKGCEYYHLMPSKPSDHWDLMLSQNPEEGTKGLDSHRRE